MSRHHEWIPIVVTTAPFVMQWVAVIVYDKRKEQKEQ